MEFFVFLCVAETIMTLPTKNSLSDFDTMSIFQDLKLKRRKIDSWCSSDRKHDMLSNLGWWFG